MGTRYEKIVICHLPLKWEKNVLCQWAVTDVTKVSGQRNSNTDIINIILSCEGERFTYRAH